MSTENQAKQQQRNPWPRVALLTYTMAGPAISALLERMRQRSRSTRASAQTLQENARSAQTDVFHRLNDLTQESRERVAEQAQQLRAQARQLKAQSYQLRKALRNEARQRRKLVKEIGKSGRDVSRGLMKQGEQLTEEFVERGGKLLEEVVGRGSKATQELAERGGRMTQELARRGRKVTRDVAERGESLLQPAREKRGRNFWPLVGFGIGLLAAAIVTYRLVRRRVALPGMEQDQHIELPARGSWDATNEVNRSQPAGEIRRVDDTGTAIATMPVVDVEDMQQADAVFVGVASTRFYYPAGTPLEVVDLVYFNSEEEAQTQGFTSAETK